MSSMFCLLLYFCHSKAPISRAEKKKTKESMVEEGEVVELKLMELE